MYIYVFVYRIPACCFFFRDTASLIKSLSASSEAPLRKASLSETSPFPSNKHTFKFPSAVIRKRLQESQKCWLMDVINPTCPTNPGTW